MAIKRPGHKRPTPSRGLAPKRRPTYTGRILSPAYPSTPIDLAGKWVAWSRDRQIVASGETLSGVATTVASMGIKDASYERLPRARRFEDR